MERLFMYLIDYCMDTPNKSSKPQSWTVLYWYSRYHAVYTSYGVFVSL